MAMNQVVTGAGERTEPLDAAGEVGQVVEDVVFVDVAVRASVDVDDARTRRIFDNIWNVRCLATCENVDRRTARGERLPELADVHVHPARLPAA